MDVRLPKLGEGSESGSVVSILVKEGARIAKGQTLIELENEKAVAAIPAPAAGTVSQLRVKEGDKISVGTVILVLAVEGEAGVAEMPPPAAPSLGPIRKSVRAGEGQTGPVPPSVEDLPPAPAEEEPASESALPPAASPSLRRLARELGIDLRRIKGSEAGGRIIMGDVRGYIQRLMRLAEQAKTAVAAGPAKAAPVSVDFSQWGPVIKKPMSSLRKTIARRMGENWSTIPHVHQFDEVDVTGLNDLRKKFAPLYEAKGARLTLTTFVLVALSRALQKHPLFNASLDEASQTIVLKDYYHLGLAVDTDAGLIVPVIRNVDKKSPLELSKDITELAAKARERKVTLDDLRGGTFTISNQGGIGGGHFTPIINKPEAAILGLGRSVLKPVVKGEQIVPRLMMPPLRRLRSPPD